MLANAGINLHQPAALQAADACVSVTHGVLTKAAVALRRGAIDRSFDRGLQTISWSHPRRQCPAAWPPSMCSVSPVTNVARSR